MSSSIIFLNIGSLHNSYPPSSHTIFVRTMNSDAPAVSSDPPSSLNQISISKSNDPTGDWDESALSAKVAKATNATATTGAGPSELMDMKALEMKRNEQDDIAERLRVEETKAQLAAAKAGMEKEAQRLKEEKDAKEAKKAEAQQPKPSGMGSGVGKWVPVHMRNSAPSRPSLGGTGSRFGNVSGVGGGTGYQRKVDTNDEMLFPDLGTVSKLMEEEEKQKEATAAAAAARQAANAPKKPKAPKEEMPAEEVKPEKAEPKPVPEAPKPVPDAPSPAPVKKKTKKKKKDLSTFKPS